MVREFTKNLFYCLSLIVSTSGYAGVLENRPSTALPSFSSVNGVILPAAVPSGSGVSRSRKSAQKTAALTVTENFKKDVA